jgi:hypothetical protein
LVLPFVVTAARRRRRFKQAIVLATLAACAGLLGGTAAGRFLIGSVASASRNVALRAAGGEPDRRQIEADWRRRRAFGVQMTRNLLRRVYREAAPGHQRLLRAAGMSPDDGLLRWGNFDGVLLLSSRVFAPDDHGRSYRLRPGVRSIWLRNVTLPHGISGFFLVPETPAILRLASECGAIPVAGSSQTTNSWGCRGPEPDPEASLRGLVLGDSYMQGLFLGDDETPSACLERDLRDRWGGSVSILNTGHLGYSPEQYYATLLEYAERFRPQLLVLSVCDNDFGGGDWGESSYWLGRIWQYGRTRGLICLTVPVPGSDQVVASRRVSAFPGRLARIAESNSSEYLDPTEDFVEAHLRLTTPALASGRLERSSPLFNLHLNDGHFSAEGARVWAAAVGRRLRLLLELRQARAARRQRVTAPGAAAAPGTARPGAGT